MAYKSKQSQQKLNTGKSKMDILCWFCIVINLVSVLWRSYGRIRPTIQHYALQGTLVKSDFCSLWILCLSILTLLHLRLTTLSNLLLTKCGTNRLITKSYVRRNEEKIRNSLEQNWSILILKLSNHLQLCTPGATWFHEARYQLCPVLTTCAQYYMSV